MSDEDDTSLRFDEDERLPWLEPIEDYEEEGTSTGRMLALALAGLVAIGAVVGGLSWWQNHGQRGNAEVIAAPEGDYKVPPKDEPGRFDGEGNVAVAAAQGETPTGNVDASRAPERPVAPPRALPATPAPAAAKAGTAAGAASATVAAGTGAAAPAPAAAAASATGGGTVQLGAFASEGTAAKAWDSLKGRFEWLGSVNRSIVPATVNGRTVYRLRAAAGTNSAARTLCQRLRVAGENCIVL